MDRARAASLAERWAPVVAVIAIVWPLAAYRYAASYDLPFHEEIVAAMRYRNDRSHYPPDFFVWHLGMPNQLFYFLAYPLAFVVSVHVACTIVLGASVAAIPLAAARLAEHLGKTRWVALAVAPIAVGFTFNCGFVGNVLGLGLVLGFLPLFDRFAAKPTITRAAEALVALLFLDCAHESAMTVGALAIALLAIGRRARLGETALRLFPPAMAFLAFAAVHLLANSIGGPEIRALPRVIFTSTGQKNEELPRMILGLHNPDHMGPATYTLAATFVLLAIDCWRARSRTGLSRDGWGAMIVPYRFVLLAGALIWAYYLLPWEVDGACWISQRYLSPGVAVLAVAIAPRAKLGPSLLTRAVSVAAVATAVALSLPAYAQTSAALTELEPLIPLIAPGSAVGNATLNSLPPRTFVFSIGGAVTRVTAERGGRTPSSFLQDSPIPPLVIAHNYRWDELELKYQGMNFRPAYDLRKLRYFIVWVLSDAVPRNGFDAGFAPDAHFVARSGAWLLYESNYPTVPIDSPEIPAPANAETLCDRLVGRSRPLR